MSRRNAKFAVISDLQCKVVNSTLTKKDLDILVKALRQMDKSQFSKRDMIDYNNLVTYLSRIGK